MVDIPDNMYDRRSSRRGSRLYRRGLRRRSPWSVVLGGVFLVLVSAGCAYDTYAANASAAKSSYTQSSGVRENATVTNVVNNKDCGRGGCTYSADVYVDLSRPVSGQTTADVSVPNSVNYTDGQTITVLVDPKDPGYAELPGQPDNQASTAIWVAVVAAVVLAFGILAIVRGVRMRLRTHSWRYVSA